MSEPKADDDNRVFDVAAGLDTLALGVSPSQSLAILSTVMAQTLGMAMYNAVGARQNAAAVRGAAITMACAGLLSLPIAETDRSSPGTGSGPTGTKQAADTAAAKAQSAAAAPVLGASASTQAGAAVAAAVVDAIDQIQRAVMSPQSVRTSGAGKAYQLVAHSAALAVQDAVDALGSMSTLAAAASGVALTKFLTTGDSKYLAGIAAAADMVKLATDDFARVSAAASAAVSGFSSG